MLLAVDVGNSAIKVAGFGRARMAGVSARPADRSARADGGARVDGGAAGAGARADGGAAGAGARADGGAAGAGAQAVGGAAGAAADATLWPDGPGTADAGASPAWVRRLVTGREASADDLEVALGDLLALEDVASEDVAGIVVVSVVPNLTAALDTIARRRWPHEPMVVASSANLPLPVRVDRPDGVGSDRLVDAYAAHHLYGGVLVVADVGTAVTVDAVGQDGAFLGGAIAAGPDLALRALSEYTAGLPRIALATPPQAIGRSTVAALQAGAAFGWRDLVAGLVGRVRAELAVHEGVAPASVRTVLTGGFAATDWGRSLGADIVDEHLTLKGLAQFYAEVTGTPVAPA